MAKSTSTKEKAMAQALLKTVGISCMKQSCGKIGACAILCEDMKCDTMNNVQAAAAAAKASVEAASSAGIWCPTQLICKPVKCGKVSCSGMKTQAA